MSATQTRGQVADKWEEENKWLYEKLAKKAVTAIERNQMTACYVPTQAEAKERILAMIPEGANAITLDGELILIDGQGNRAAALIFGPKKVIVVAGANKIVKDYESAFRRIKDYAVGRTARMLGHDTPCTRTGYCSPAKGLDHCLHPHRICCATVRISGQYDKDRINVFIIGEDLGF